MFLSSFSRRRKKKKTKLREETAPAQTHSLKEEKTLKQTKKNLFIFLASPHLAFFPPALFTQAFSKSRLPGVGAGDKRRSLLDFRLNTHQIQSILGSLQTNSSGSPGTLFDHRKQESPPGRGGPGRGGRRAVTPAREAKNRSRPAAKTKWKQ